jgi:hypothetical protein
MRTRTAQSKTHRANLPNRKVLSAWMITLAATAASTYALDALATAAGMLLVASGLLSGLDHPLVLGFLAATYVLWAVALRTNLGANWSLLRLTGTSTNALSKAAFELTKRRRARTQRIAAAVGYVATELVKEAPYYAGAFGAATLADSVSSNDALLFLAGTNLGAAAYEYGLARLTHRFLRHRRNAPVGTDRVQQRDHHRRVTSRPTAPVPPAGATERVEVHRADGIDDEPRDAGLRHPRPHSRRHRKRQLAGAGHHARAKACGWLRGAVSTPEADRGRRGYR